MEVIDKIKYSFKKAENIVEDNATDVNLFLLWKKNSKSNMQFSSLITGDEFLADRDE